MDVDVEEWVVVLQYMREFAAQRIAVAYGAVDCRLSTEKTRGHNLKQEILRKLPSIDELMNVPVISALVDEHDREVVVDAARQAVDGVRREILSAKDVSSLQEFVSLEAIASRVVSAIRAKFAYSIRAAINATGIILHTGLGRAMFAQEAIQQMNNVGAGYCNLAIDLDTGQRGSRDAHISDLLTQVTGAQACTVVNNNAAATMLVLNTLASGKEVIVSRGQLVEIGGSFRMPDVMAASGAILREVGTTNKTHLRDYVEAINENTGAILKVHQSNYRIVGFTEEPSIWELAEIGRKYNLPVIDDLGSGCLVDLRQYGIAPEPMVQDSVQAGADVACFSGDKLIGGPQCGIIVGKSDAIARIKKNQLARALRVDKLTVAGLEATLRLFIDKGKLNQRHPTYRMLSLTPEELELRAQAAAEQLGRIDARVEIVDGTSQVGSGTSPAETLKSRHLSIRPNSMSADALAKRLRLRDVPIVPRVHQDAVLFDFRTVQSGEDEIMVQALRELLGQGEPQ